MQPTKVAVTAGAVMAVAASPVPLHFDLKGAFEAPFSC